MDDIFYVYTYLDPRKPGNFNYGKYHFNYEPFYAGKGCGERIWDHLAKKEINKHNFKAYKIKKLIRLGYDLKQGFIKKIKENLMEKESIDLEIKIIKTIGRKNLGLGPLTNLTDGGEGISGYKHTQETKNEYSKKRMGNKYAFGFKHSEKTKKKFSEQRKGHRGWNIGMIHKKETKLKISNSLKGRKPWNLGIPQKEETKLKISNSLKGKPPTRGNTGKIASKITRIKMSTNMRKVTDEQIIAIKNLRKNGLSFGKIAKIIGYSKPTIMNVIKNKALYLIGK